MTPATQMEISGTKVGVFGDPERFLKRWQEGLPDIVKNAWHREEC